MPDKERFIKFYTVGYRIGRRINDQRLSAGGEAWFCRCLHAMDSYQIFPDDPEELLDDVAIKRVGQWSPQQVAAWMDELAGVGLIHRFTGDDGNRYACVINGKPQWHGPNGKARKHYPHPTELVYWNGDTWIFKSNESKQSKKSKQSKESKRLEERRGEEKREEKDNPPNPLRGDVCLGFDSFWKEWPKHERKIGRSQCLRAWKRLNLGPITEKVIASLRRCKVSHGWTKEGGKYIPKPITWLNETPWETDLAEMVSGPNLLQSKRAKLDRELAEAQRAERTHAIARIKAEIAALESQGVTP